MQWLIQLHWGGLKIPDVGSELENTPWPWSSPEMKGRFRESKVSGLSESKTLEMGDAQGKADAVNP